MTNATQNVDPGEIHKFSELASRWWDPNSEFKPLHDINPLRVDYIERHAGIHGKKILDVGCGGGILAEALASRGGQVKGIDMAEAGLEVARLHLLESGHDINYQKTPVENLVDQEAGSYDIVTCLEMLEHVPDPGSVIAACQKLVKPDGHVFFSTINRNPKSYLFAIIGAEYVLNMLPRGTHEYAKFIKPSELDAWARSAQLELEDIKGMTYNPLTKFYRLGSDVDVNYLTCYRNHA